MAALTLSADQAASDLHEISRNYISQWDNARRQYLALAFGHEAHVLGQVGLGNEGQVLGLSLGF